MIRQIAPIPQAPSKPTVFNKGLLQARRIQRNVKNRITKPDHGLLWSPFTPGPVLVPVTRWIE